MAKHVGRPLKTHAAGTEVTVSVLMPSELKTKLQEHAVDAKRTLSAEAQLRLEQSMQTAGRAGLLPDALQLAFGELGGIVLLVAIAMERGGRLAAWNATHDPDVWMDDRWLTVPEAYDAAVQLAHYALEVSPASRKGCAPRATLRLCGDDRRLPRPPLGRRAAICPVHPPHPQPVHRETDAGLQANRDGEQP